MVKIRFSQLQKSRWIIPIAALTLLSVVTLSAQTITLSVPEEVEVVVPLRLELIVLQVTLAEENPFGVSLTTNEIIAELRSDGLETLGETLAESGEVSLIHRGQHSCLTNEVAQVDVGREVPILMTRRSDDGEVSVTQQAVREGILAEIRPQIVGDDALLLSHRIELNIAQRVERQGTELIERATFQWEGNSAVEFPDGVLVGRFVRLFNERPTELLFILQVTE